MSPGSLTSVDVQKKATYLCGDGGLPPWGREWAPGAAVCSWQQFVAFVCVWWGERAAPRPGRGGHSSPAELGRVPGSLGQPWEAEL